MFCLLGLYFQRNNPVGEYSMEVFSNVFIVEFEQVFSRRKHIIASLPIIMNSHTRGTSRTPFNTHFQISENFIIVKTRKVS